MCRARRVIVITFVAIGVSTVVVTMVLPIFRRVQESGLGGGSPWALRAVARASDSYCHDYSVYPHDGQSSDKALVNALHRLHLSPEFRLWNPDRLLRPVGEETDYYYLNDPQAFRLPDDTILLVEKPWPTAKRGLLVMDIRQTLYVLVDRRVVPQMVLGKSSSQLVRESKIAPVRYYQPTPGRYIWDQMWYDVKTCLGILEEDGWQVWDAEKGRWARMEGIGKW